MTQPPHSVVDLDYLRQDIRFDAVLRDIPLRFCSTWGLFSPKTIDQGSEMLLDYIEVDIADHCFDLGCGYGPLGIALAKLAPQGRSVLVDKDFVAVNYSQKNAALNGVTNADIFLSNGFDQVEQTDFQVIVSNLPAKTSKESYHLYFYDALQKMVPGARFYVVTINGLRQFIDRSFKEVFGNYKKLKQGKTYTVAMAIKE